MAAVRAAQRRRPALTLLPGFSLILDLLSSMPILCSEGDISTHVIGGTCFKIVHALEIQHLEFKDLLLFHHVDIYLVPFLSV